MRKNIDNICQDKSTGNALNPSARRLFSLARFFRRVLREQLSKERAKQ
jgi:hypothetical protein